MGLTAWKSEIVRKSDVTIAKNYLNEIEVGELNRIVTMWLDFAEDLARRRKQVFLKDWETKLNEFLVFNERAVLTAKGGVSKARADELAEREYERFGEWRRAQLEAEAERVPGAELEDAAKQSPSGKPNRGTLRFRPRRWPRRGGSKRVWESATCALRSTPRSRSAPRFRCSGFAAARIPVH